LGLLARLAVPASEDWYVFAPAMAAAKELLLVRPQARVIFADLSVSPDAENRRSAAQALLEVARVDASAVPTNVAATLAADPDEGVAEVGSMLRSFIGGRSRNMRIGHFGL
jgi:hypothetical protein